ncbi:hypothetical protein B0I35DRAFT_356032 [Stachybotrys elegans]|uniref:Erythromycin biosynthesis protein CIII-like C-terminal domain-containing protein n=1 Tax=Stachybotrys elegans TaxID=80388 RepID=A0A8K0SLE1_9HYPO|nr:hypothetical protein B0I35DRAFT_356032 [Stachybotrys elegans]
MAINVEPAGSEAKKSGNAYRKPRLLFCANPASGHAGPVLRVASELAALGFDITFLTGKDFHGAITKFGGRPLLIDDIAPEVMAEYQKMPAGMEKMMYGMERFFVRSAGEHANKVYNALEMMNDEDPNWPIVIVNETSFTSTHPLYLGAPPPKGMATRPPILGLHIIPYIATSRDTFPFGMGLAPDTTEEGRAKMQGARELTKNGPFGALVGIQAEVMQKLGAVNYKPYDSIFDTWVLSHDTVLHMVPPSAEYTMSDVPEKFRFAGTPLPAAVKGDVSYPEFWDEVTSGKKKVVLAVQGTVSTDYNQIILPTITGLAKRDDLLVVSILGIRGATLPADFALPANTRVIDYFSYDLILPYTSVMVFNAGYGGFIHGVVHGVPMVMAGANEDKPDVAMRGEWAGVGVNLRTGDPTPGQLAEGVREILGNPKYKQRAMAIKKENEEMNAIKVVEKAIYDLAGMQALAA